MNIVETLLKMFSGGGGGQLAGLLGLGEEQTQTAVKAALPALLAALAGASASTEGGQRLASAVKGADEGVLGNLDSVLRAQGTAVADQGNSMLSNLLPGELLRNLTNVLGKFTGMSPGTVTTLLTTLAPVVLGFLKRETKFSGFAPSALTNLLASQKDNIAKALPGGLGNLLGEIPGLGQFAAVAQGARETVGNMTNRAVTAGNQGRAAATEAVGAGRWMVPLLLALVLGGLAWAYWPTPVRDAPIAKREAPEGMSIVERSNTVTAAKVTHELADLISTATSETKDIFADATSALNSVDDAATAEQAAERLPPLTERLEKLKVTLADLPDGARNTILNLVAELRVPFLKVIDKAMAIPGVSAVLSPHVDKLRQALDALSV